MISAVGCFVLSYFRFIPNLSQTAYFKKFTVFQALTGFAAYTWYFYEINKIGKTIPKSELEIKKL